MVAVTIVGLAIAPIYPAMMSSTHTRVGSRDTANTIGLQMAATSLGMAIIPSLMGVLSRQYSLEVIPICRLVVYVGWLGFYNLVQRNLHHLSSVSS